MVWVQEPLSTTPEDHIHSTSIPASLFPIEYLKDTGREMKNQRNDNFTFKKLKGITKLHANTPLELLDWIFGIYWLGLKK